ncbi:MAG: DUF3566 domain-containing protein [Candidatus Micrarchaeota archaeon]
MQKVTLTHIGAVSLGKLLAIWSFVLGVVLMVIMSIIMVLMTLLGMAASNNPMDAFGGGIIGLIMFFIFGLIGLVVNSILAFIMGFLSATVYNIVLKVGGGIDFDLNDRG